jgi:hypothetical protein
MAVLRHRVYSSVTLETIALPCDVIAAARRSSYVVIASLAAWRADCCLATRNNIRNSIVACVYSVAECVT